MNIETTHQTVETIVGIGKGGALKWFIHSAGVILAITGLAKVWSGLGDSKFLAVVDPIFGVKFGPLMLAVGLVEIVIALVCLFSKRQTLALGLVAWLSTSFVIYRLGLWWMNWHRPCNCLGNLTDALHLSPQAADNIMKVVLAYLLIGSYGLLIAQWRIRTHDMARRPVTAFLAFLLWIGVTLPASSQQFVKISAEIETSYFPTGDPTDNSKVKRWPISVVCVAGTNEWRIDDNYLENGERQWLYDGTNVYKSSMITKGASSELTAKLKAIGIIAAPVEVARSNRTIYIDTSLDGHPLGDVGVNIAWLAFCSGTYLKREGRVIPIPVTAATLRLTPDGFGYSDTSQTYRDEFGLPREVELFSSTSLFEQSVKMRHFEGAHNIGNHEVKIKSHGNGKLKFHYTVIESTNFLGWNFPVKFEYLQNEIDDRGETIPRFAGKGKVMKFEKSNRPEGIFLPGYNQTIVDRRLAEVGKPMSTMAYRSAMASALPTNDPGLQQILTSQLNRTPPPKLQKQAHSSSTRVVVISLLAASVVVLVAFAFVSKQNKRNKNIKTL